MLSIYININNIEMLQKVARVFTKFTIGITFGAIVCYTIVPPPGPSSSGPLPLLMISSKSSTILRSTLPDKGVYV